MIDIKEFNKERTKKLTSGFDIFKRMVNTFCQIYDVKDLNLTYDKKQGVKAGIIFEVPECLKFNLNNNEEKIEK